MAVKTVIDGDSIRLMKDGKIVTSNFDKAGLSVRDFLMLLHQRGYRNLDELRNVWFEYNGQMTVVRKGDEATATALVESGEVNEKNLERLDRSREWLDEELKKHRAKLEDIFCAEWHDGRLWIYPVEREPDETA